jgi:hypothetical protein
MRSLLGQQVKLRTSAETLGIGGRVNGAEKEFKSEAMAEGEKPGSNFL